MTTPAFLSFAQNSRDIVIVFVKVIDASSPEFQSVRLGVVYGFRARHVSACTEECQPVSNYHCPQRIRGWQEEARIRSRFTPARVDEFLEGAFYKSMERTLPARALSTTTRDRNVP